LSCLDYFINETLFEISSLSSIKVDFKCVPQVFSHAGNAFFFNQNKKKNKKIVFKTVISVIIGHNIEEDTCLDRTNDLLLSISNKIKNKIMVTIFAHHNGLPDRRSSHRFLFYLSSAFYQIGRPLPLASLMLLQFVLV
jgi:hypothetical protein